MRSPVTRTLLRVIVATALSAAAASAQTAGPKDPREAQPERPTVATHAYTVAPGIVELETGFQQQHPSPSSNLIGVPVLFKIGLTDRLQLDVAPGWLRLTGRNRCRGGAHGSRARREVAGGRPLDRARRVRDPADGIAGNGIGRQRHRIGKRVNDACSRFRAGTIRPGRPGSQRRLHAAGRRRHRPAQERHGVDGLDRLPGGRPAELGCGVLRLSAHDGSVGAAGNRRVPDGADACRYTRASSLDAGVVLNITRLGGTRSTPA